MTDRQPPEGNCSSLRSASHRLPGAEITLFDRKPDTGRVRGTRPPVGARSEQLQRVDLHPYRVRCLPGAAYPGSLPQRRRQRRPARPGGTQQHAFLVVAGRFRMEFRDRHVWVEAGEFLIVPRGVEHRPVADEEAHVLLFEPASTLNTGDVRDGRTVDRPEWV